MNRNYPCKTCEDRHEGCHSKCERYQAIDKANREELEQRRKEKEGENQWIDHMATQRRKRRKMHGKK